MHELAVWQRQKQTEYKAEVDDEQQRHHGLAAKHEQQQAGGAGHEQHQDERFVQAILRRIGERRIAAAAKREQPRRADQQSGAAERAEHHREAAVTVRRAPSEHDMVERGDARRRKAQRKTVERRSDETTGATETAALPPSCSRRRCRADVAASARPRCRASLTRMPAPWNRRRTRARREQQPMASASAANTAGQSEERDHRVVGDDAIEIAGRLGRPDVRARHHGQRQDHRARCEGHDPCRDDAAPPERGAKRRRPAILFVRCEADLRERPRHVDAELVRRRVLAGVKTLAAVVAQVREIGEIALGERQPVFHGRKHRAISFAVAAGVAHRHHVLAARESFQETAWRPASSAGDPAEHRADRHADAGDVALAKNVARHDFAGGEHIGRRLSVVHDHARALVDFQPEVGEGDARPQRIAPERRRVERLRPVGLVRRQPFGAAVVEHLVIERARRRRPG